MEWNTKQATEYEIPHPPPSFFPLLPHKTSPRSSKQILTVRTLEHRIRFCRAFEWEQGWRSSETTGLPPMWPGFDSRPRCHTCGQSLLFRVLRISRPHKTQYLIQFNMIWFDLCLTMLPISTSVLGTVDTQIKFIIVPIVNFSSPILQNGPLLEKWRQKVGKRSNEHLTDLVSSVLTVSYETLFLL